MENTIRENNSDADDCSLGGNGIYSMIVSIARQLCVLLPVAYLFSLSGNVNLIWWAFPIAELMSVGMSTFFLVKINKKRC